MKPKSYVGITGFKEPSEVLRAAKFYLESGFFDSNKDFLSKNYKPMFGFVCSARRLADKSKQGIQSPRANDLGSLTKCTPKGVLSMIHYATKNRRNLSEEIKEVFTLDKMYENNYCRAVQLNMVWPDIDQIELIKEEFPEMQIVLQLPKNILTDVTRAKDYAELADYCLIDPSGGKGSEISNQYLDLAKSLLKLMPNTRIGVAGGLCENTVQDVIKTVYKQINEPFSIDAQGKLTCGPNASLDVKKANGYISSAAEIIRYVHSHN